MQTDLLGYLFGALEDSEWNRVHCRLATDSRMQKELDTLREETAFLRYPAPLAEPPDDLVAKTMAMVATAKEEERIPVRPR